MRFFSRIKDSFVLQTLRDALPGVLFAAVLILVYAVVQLNDNLTEARQKEAVQSALLCPSRLGELLFSHSGFTKLDPTQPDSVKISCYYARGVKG